MRKPSNIEAIRFHEFVYRHFGHGYSNRNDEQTFYLSTDDNKFRKIYHDAWTDENRKKGKDDKCLVLRDIYKLFVATEKKFGNYGCVSSDKIEEYLTKEVPKWQ